MGLFLIEDADILKQNEQQSKGTKTGISDIY